MDTTFTEFEGRVLRLRYPSFLKLKTEDPWYAKGARRYAQVLIHVSPPQSTAEAFAHMIRSPNFAATPGASILRDGSFSTTKGIKGHERVTKMPETMGWFVDGKFRNRDAVTIQISVASVEWHDGSIWLDLLNSIEIT
jgi:hypothetical protein